MPGRSHIKSTSPPPLCDTDVMCTNFEQQPYVGRANPSLSIDYPSLDVHPNSRRQLSMRKPRQHNGHKMSTVGTVLTKSGDSGPSISTVRTAVVVLLAQRPERSQYPTVSDNNLHALLLIWPLS